MTDTPFPQNPYVIGVPLTGEVGFYGRRAVFTFVEDTLDTEQQNVIVLYGQRRVGKTSLLHQLARQLKDSEVLPVYFDLQGRAQQSLGRVLYELTRTIARPLKMKVEEQAKFDQAGHFFREEFLPSLYHLLDQRRLLLLFDEFDVLGDELTSPEAASETLFPYLQDLIMHQQQIAFIFVVGRHIEELATHFQSVFKQAVYQRVGLLRQEDARALIVEPVRDILTFEESAIEAILSLTAGHPYFTQLICYETFNVMKTQNRQVVTQVDVVGRITQAIESGHGALAWFWDGLSRTERFIMSAVAHTANNIGLVTSESIRQILEEHRIVLTRLELIAALNRLVEWEMLRRDGSNYHFVVELVQRWIITERSLESIEGIDYIAKRAIRHYENAYDAHTIMGDLEFARDEYARALAANSNHSGAQLGLAQVLFELKEIEASIEEFEKAYAFDEIRARDGLVRACLAYGKKLEETYQKNDAILQYERVLKVSPLNESARQRLAAIWLDRGHEALVTENLEATIESYKKALDFKSNEIIIQEIKSQLEKYAKQTEEKHNYEDVFKVINQLKDLLPGDEIGLILEVDFWIRQGDALLEEGKEKRAIHAYQLAYELNPNNVDLNLKLRAISAKSERPFKTSGLDIPKPANPFIYSKSVDVKQFIGRINEVEQIFSQLSHQACGSVAIIGEQNIGKTSLLHYVSKYPKVAKHWNIDKQNSIFIYLDCGTINPFTIARFWRVVLNQMVRFLKSIDPDDPLLTYVRNLTTSEIATSDVVDLLDEIQDNGRVLVLLLDEFESLVNLDQEREVITQDLLNGLRGLINHHTRTLSIIVSTRRSLEEVCRDIKFKGTPFYENLVSIHLGLLNKNEAEILFDQLLAETDIIFLQTEKDYIFELAGTHPMLLQAAASLVFDFKVGNAMQIKNFDDIREKFYSIVQRTFKEFWRRSQLRERQILVHLASGNEQETIYQLGEWSDEYNRLLERGLIIETKNGTYFLFSPSFRQWLIDNIHRPEDIPPPDSSQISDLKQQLLVHYRRLNILELQLAKVGGVNAPSGLVMDIEETKTKIKDLEKQITEAREEQLLMNLS